MTRARALVGCSGYDYPHWRGRFYPAELRHSDWFEHYSGVFDTVEINSTFYRLPDAATVRSWRQRAPRGFTYSVKLSQYGTHRKHLADPDEWLSGFIEVIGELGPTLGPVLVQLPPRWRADPSRLGDFLAAAPADMRWAIEVRDPSWLCQAVYDVLTDHGAALCVHDLIPDHPRIATADWLYFRFHGPSPGDLYGGSYSIQALVGAARRIRSQLGAGHDVYAYFNNDRGATAPADAARLRRYLGRTRPLAGREPET